MTALAFLNSLDARGISLRVTPRDTIAISPAALLTDEDRAALKALKPDIIDYLTDSVCWKVGTRVLVWMPLYDEWFPSTFVGADMGLRNEDDSDPRTGTIPPYRGWIEVQRDDAAFRTTEPPSWVRLLMGVSTDG